MKKLDRHIGSTVLGSMLVVMLIVVFLDTLFAFMAQLDTTRANYQLPQVVQYIGLTTPKRIYEIIPVASLIGCLLGLGTLANHSELVIIRAAGISLWRIAWAVLKPAMVLMFLGLFLGEIVAPWSGQAADTLRKTARMTASHDMREGLWYREGNNFMYFNVIEPNGKIHGVNIYTFNERKELLRTVYAETATFKDNYWLLDSIATSSYTKNQVVKEEQNQQVWQTALTVDLLRIMTVDPDDLAMSGLLTYIRYLDSEGMDSGESRLALYKKFLQPAAIFALVLIGMSFVFGPLRAVPMGLRLFVGVATGVVFMIAQNLMGPASLVFGFAPFMAVLTPILICFAIGFVLLKRAG